MSLASGRPYLAIPGPSTMPDRVLQAMHRGAPNIYCVLTLEPAVDAGRGGRMREVGGW